MNQLTLSSEEGWGGVTSDSMSDIPLHVGGIITQVAISIKWNALNYTVMALIPHLYPCGVYCGQYRSVLPLMSSLCSWSRFKGSLGIFWWNPNCLITRSAWCSPTVVKHISATTTWLIGEISMVIRWLTSLQRYRVHKNCNNRWH